MPIYLHEKISQKGEIGLWDIVENEDFFRSKLNISEQEEGSLSQMQLSRRKEWLAGRYLLHQMSGRNAPLDIQKDEFGKPHLPDSEFDISLSHSGRFAAVIASPEVVGIDIQRLDQKVKRIERKFMTQTDLTWISEEFNLEHLHVCWGAKEALYKAYGKKKLEFREHILLEPFEYDVTFGTCLGYVRKEFEEKENVDLSFDIYYKMIENYMLVYAIQNEKY